MYELPPEAERLNNLVALGALVFLVIALLVGHFVLRSTNQVNPTQEHMMVDTNDFGVGYDD
jgi:hypothetical protein